MGDRYPLEPSGLGKEVEEEQRERFAEEVHNVRQAEAAEHRPQIPTSSLIAAILVLAGAVLMFVATINRVLDTFKTASTRSSISYAMDAWGPVALLLVAGVLALASGRPVRAIAAGLAVGVGGLILIDAAAFLIFAGDFDLGWNFYVEIAGSVAALAGGLVAIFTARTKA